MAVKISSIEALIAVARESQCVFRELDIANTFFKQSIAEKYLRNPEAIPTRVTKVNTYDLELLSVGITLKRFRLKKEQPAWKAFLEKAKKIEFSINTKRLTRNTLRIQLEHYKEDTLEDVVEYVKEYAEYHLKKIPSLWSLIALFFKSIWRLTAPFFKSIWRLISPFF